MKKDFEDGLFADEKNEALSDKKDSWKILIVDDEEEIHSVTKLVLSHVTFEGKGMSFLSAYTGEEALHLIKENPDVAIILLDVVMENEDAGLKVVKEIRNVINNKFVRIILRTGQPGQAPEEDIVIHYDINDYKTKEELTARKLFTTVIQSIRAYKDMLRIDQSRKGLRQIIESSASLFELHSMEKLVSGALIQLISLLSLNADSLFCRISGFFSSGSGTENDYAIVSGTGKFEKQVNQQVKNVVPKEILEIIKNAYTKKENIYTDRFAIVFFITKNSSDSFIYLENYRMFDDDQKEIIGVFCKNASIAFDRVYTYEQVHIAQEAALKTLSNLAEFNDEYNSAHLQRVRNLSMKTAQKLYEQGKFKDEIDANFVQQISIASILHDVGKIGVPEKILLKPEKLTKEEYEEIKKHTILGSRILGAAANGVEGVTYLKTAVEIAIGHHEKHNGRGYPKGLAGDEIPVAAKIVAVVDVYDALSARRPYKDAWPQQNAIEIIKEESGSQFDPVVVQAFLEIVDNDDNE